MRVLAHVHTFDDSDVIEQALDALLRQTRRPDAILIVDNASTDGTLERTFPEQVTIIRHPLNLGTSGAIRTGFTYALEHEFDWVWIFDADSAPEPDALKNLLHFFARLPPSQQEQVCFLVCRPVSATGQTKHEPMIFTDSGAEPAPPAPDAGYSRCDCALWSGSLYRMAAVNKIGLPDADYVLDWAELEYGYRARQLGFTSYMVDRCVLHHDMGGTPGLAPQTCRLGPFRFQLYELSPPRCYYQVRNSIYFWLHQCKHRRMSRAVRNIGRSLVFTMTFAIRPISHRRQLIACLRGCWDGLTMHMERRH
jgi:rhamnopyranosyl-N-acetylglucosaminyl-diphospho-decaprenol beta-1,3/1,4-galactofuranosyltransferase